MNGLPLGFVGLGSFEILNVAINCGVANLISENQKREVVQKGFQWIPLY